MPASRRPHLSPPPARVAALPQPAVRRSVLALVVALVAALAVLLALPAVAPAEKPFRVASQIEDPAGVLAGDEASVAAAIKALQTAGHVQLWVVYVDTFSGMDAQDWTDATARKSDLGLNDVLLAVAVQDRAYAYSVDQDFELSQSQMDDVMVQRVEPALQDDQWAAAAVGAATGMLQEIVDKPLADLTSIPDAIASETSKMVTTVVWTMIVVVIVIILLVALALVLLSRRSARQKKAAAGPPPVPLDELRRQANAALVETDDAVKTSTEELGFAVAEFGDDQAAPFKQALDAAQVELDEAFKLRRELEDAQDEAAQRQLLSGILAHTQAANDGLDAQADRFDKLRDLEQNASDVLTRLEAQAAELEQRRPETEKALAELSGVYAPTAVAPVATTPADAVARLEFARQQIAAGKDDLAGGRKGEAAVDALAAEAAVGQAQQLLDSVERLRQDLAGAQQLIDAAIAETRKDIAEAQAAAGGPQLQSLVAAADTAVAAAAEAAGPTGGRDPLGALRRLKDADDALEQALQQVRDVQAQFAKAAESCKRSLGGARAALASADDYIRTHRGGVDAGPRTTLAEARRELAQAEALASTDPASGAKHANRAQKLSEQAFTTAQVQSGEMPAGGGGASGGALVAGMVLGGVLARTLGGGGFGGFGGGQGGGGAVGVPGFGGGGTRMRRGGGGRF